MRMGQKIRNRHPVMLTTHLKNPLISYYGKELSDGKPYRRDEEQKYRKK